MQIQAAHMGHGTMSNCAEETAGNAGKIAISLVGMEAGKSTLGKGEMQMQPANGVIVAIKSNGSNGNNSSLGNNGNNNCSKTCIGLSNGSGNGKMGGVARKERAQVEVGGKSGSSLPACQSSLPAQSSNGVKSVSALLNGMQLSYQAKAVDALLTGKVTKTIFLMKIANIRMIQTVMTNIRLIYKG